MFTDLFSASLFLDLFFFSYVLRNVRCLPGFSALGTCFRVKSSAQMDHATHVDESFAAFTKEKQNSLLKKKRTLCSLQRELSEPVWLQIPITTLFLLPLLQAEEQHVFSVLLLSNVAPLAVLQVTSADRETFRKTAGGRMKKKPTVRAGLVPVWCC